MEEVVFRYYQLCYSQSNGGPAGRMYARHHRDDTSLEPFVRKQKNVWVKNVY